MAAKRISAMDALPRGDDIVERAAAVRHELLVGWATRAAAHRGGEIAGRRVRRNAAATTAAAAAIARRVYGRRRDRGPTRRRRCPNMSVGRFGGAHRQLETAQTRCKLRRICDGALGKADERFVRVAALERRRHATPTVKRSYEQTKKCALMIFGLWGGG